MIRKKNQKRMRRKMKRKRRKKTKRRMIKKMIKRMIKKMIKRRKRRNREYFLLNLNAIKCSYVFSPELSKFVYFLYFILENTFGLWIQRQICTITG